MVERITPERAKSKSTSVHIRCLQESQTVPSVHSALRIRKVEGTGWGVTSEQGQIRKRLLYSAEEPALRLEGHEGHLEIYSEET